MVGFELLIAPAAEGLAALISDTTKTGSSSVIGSIVKGLADKSKQTIFIASRKYIETYQKRHCQLKVLGMSEPVELSAVYTGVKLLSQKDMTEFEPEALEDAFRQSRFRGYSSSRAEDEKQSGIALANQKQYLMVLGGPGAGKSTFLRKVGLEALRTLYYEQAAYCPRLIPVLLDLKRFDSEDIDITKSIAAEFETCGFPEAAAFTQNALAQGNLLVLLDGLDEVPSANLNKVLKTIQDFVDRYDSNRFIASCRVAASGYRSEAFKRFTNVTMADFDDEQIYQFIDNWFGSEQDRELNTSGKCWEVLQRPENKASKELAHTPLLLTYLCLIYGRSQRFPRNRSSIYQKALRILLEEWAAEKNILRDEIHEDLNIEQEETLLSEIAYEGMAVDQLFFTKRELSSRIKAFLTGNLNTPKRLDSEKVLKAIEVQQGILVERAEGVYSFSHLTLQEYLTAQYLVDNNEWEALIQQHLTDTRWREIFLLLPGLLPGKPGADNFLLAMEKQASTYLHNPELQPLVQWAETSTKGSDGKAQPSAKRAAAIFCALNLNPELNYAINHAQDLALALARAHDSAHDSALTLAHDLALNRAHIRKSPLTRDYDLALDHAFAIALAHASIFSNFNSDGLRQGIEVLRTNKPQENAERLKVAQLLEKLRGLWSSAMGIEAEAAMLSHAALESIANYFYACELMIRCKEGAMKVSPDVWAGIESRILVLPSSKTTAE